jgi:predicted DNA-binding protein (MmcQ/YjbR family)
VNLKCDPERAIELREEYEAIQPGWHMNKVTIELFYTLIEQLMKIIGGDDRK